MKKLVMSAAILLSANAMADSYVKPYMRSDGTYVEGYMRSSPNGNPYDNYSTQGNTNPYTGANGHKAPDSYNSGGYGQQNYGSSYGDGLIEQHHRHRPY